MLQIDFLGIENSLIRKGLSFHTIPGRLGGIRRLNLKGALESKEAFEAYTVKFFRAGGTKSYFNKEVQALKDWGAFYKQEWVKEIKSLKPDDKIRSSFTDDEVERFLALESTPFWKTFWTFWAYIGCRPMEIRSLLSQDVNLQIPSVLFKGTKTHSDRQAPISETVLPLLTQHLPTAGKYLFGMGDSMMSDGTYLKDFKVRCRKLGIVGRQPYSFRHSLATRLLEEGASLFAVQDILGQSDPKTTRRYYHGNMNTMLKALKKDPLSRKSLTSQQDLQQIIDLLRPYVEQNDHFSYSFGNDSIQINIKSN